MRGAPAGPYGVVTPAGLGQRLRHLPALLDPTPFATMQAASAAAIRAGQPLPPLEGPVDVYTFLQARVLAHDLEFRPRPVFQSFLAYTPRLARENAAFLESEWAPRWVFFQPGALDNGFPPLADALSWPLLLSRFDLVSRHGAMILLGRRDAPLPWRVVPLATMRTTTDTPIEVPEDDLVWAQIDVHEELADRLAAVALSAPTAWLHLIFADGHAASYRMTTPLARAGFLLSPMVDRAEALADIMTGAAAPAARVVRRIEVELRSPIDGPWPSRVVTAEFGRLEIDRAVAAAGTPVVAPPPGS